MSSLDDDSGPDSDKRPLGQLLVDAGLLSSADLGEVLAKQRDSGLPLGRMLVDGGYVAAHSIAMALAEQHGGLLKTEYGFATGRAGIRPSELRGVDEPIPGHVPAVESPQGGTMGAGLRLAGATEQDELRVEVPAPVAPSIEELRVELPEPVAPVVDEVRVELPAPVAPVVDDVRVELPTPAPPVVDEVRVELPEPAPPSSEETASEPAAYEPAAYVPAPYVPAPSPIDELRVEPAPPVLDELRVETPLPPPPEPAEFHIELPEPVEFHIEPIAPAELATDESRLELEAAVAELQTRYDDGQARYEELEARHQELGARYQTLEGRFHEAELAAGHVDEATAKQAELEARGVGLQELNAELEARYADLRARYRELEEHSRVQAAALESVRAGFEDAVARLEAERSRTGPAPGPVRSDDRHELFVPTGEGYSLLERPGPAPAAGTEVELSSGERFSVMRVGPSPLPGEAHACAYLDRIGSGVDDSLTGAL
jgi:hypothetical protein